MKGKRLRRLSGTVLIMVLTVMLVLIIMLMATLTVVTTASQRIYTKYEENQAYYTARSALDVYVEKLLRDKDGYAMKSAGVEWKYVYADADGNEKLQDSSTHMKQGLALQLDLYNLKSLNKDVSGNALTDFGVMENADSASGVFCTKTGYRDFASTANEYIMYQVQMPSSTDSSSGRSQISDNVKDKSNNTYNDITIKIEVLDRRYSLGGSNADAFEAAISTNEALFASAVVSAAKDTAAITGSLTLRDLKKAILLGDRKKDKMTLKVTATAAFRGAEESAVLVFDISDPPIINGTRAITAFGSASSIDNMTVVGGVSVPNDTTAENTGAITGNVYIKGDYNNGDGGTSYELIDSECFYIESGNCTWTNSLNIKGYNSKSPTDSDYKNTRPFLFVDGIYGNSLNAANAGFPGNEVDLLTKGISGLNNGFEHYGDIYVDGNIDFSGLGANTPKIDGDIYVSGTVTYGVDGDGDTVYPKKPGGGSVSVISASVSFTDSDTSTADKIDIVLPNGVKKTLPTETSIYSEHYKDNDITDPTKLFTAEELAYLTKEQRLNGETTTKTFASEAALVSGSNNWYIYNNVLCYGHMVTSPWGSYMEKDGEITASQDPELGTVYTMTSGSYKFAPNSTSLSGNGKILVSGGGIVDLYLTPGTYQNDLCIVVDDDTTLRIFGDTPSGNYDMHNVTIANRSIYNAIENGKDVYVGQKGSGMVAPTISMYFDSGSTISMKKTLFTGYVQGPDAEVAISESISIDNVKYNNVSIGTKKLTVIGSILCKDLNCTDMGGVAYINPNVPTTAEGDPILNFEAVQYRRN